MNMWGAGAGDTDLSTCWARYADDSYCSFPRSSRKGIYRLLIVVNMVQTMHGRYQKMPYAFVCAMVQPILP
jgi:hypothetical protein